MYLNRAAVPLIDAADEDWGLQHKWCLVNHKGRLYAAKRCREQARIVYLHRFVMDASPGAEVRFLDGYTLDCRRCNLWLYTKADLDRDLRPRCQAP